MDVKIKITDDTYNSEIHTEELKILERRYDFNRMGDRRSELKRWCILALICLSTVTLFFL